MGRPIGPHAGTVNFFEREFRRAQLTDEATRAVSAILTTICNNPHVLLTVAAAGRQAWFLRAPKMLRGLPVDDTVLNAMWQYIAHRAGPEPGRTLDQVERRMADQSTPAHRDVHVVATDNRGNVIEDDNFDR